MALKSKMRAEEFEVKTPELRRMGLTWWQSVMYWLLAPAPYVQPKPIDRLAITKGEINRTLGNLPLSEELAQLVGRVDAANSIRELNQMKLEIHAAIALHHDDDLAGSKVRHLFRNMPIRVR